MIRCAEFAVRRSLMPQRLNVEIEVKLKTIDENSSLSLVAS
jgi:hypothetical protein